MHRLVFVHDPTDSGDYVIPIGKQTLEQSHIFYTPCSGIWQTVWIESAPSNYATALDLDANMEGKVNITVHSEQTADVEVQVIDKKSNEVIGTHKGVSNQPCVFTVDDAPELWSPDSPTLYDVKVTMGEDEFSSYTGFKTYSKGEVNGIPRPLINGEFVFKFGTLDQGFWPDGLYTAPTVEAMRYDLEVLKKLGFNMLRKHVSNPPPTLSSSHLMPPRSKSSPHSSTKPATNSA